MTGLYICQDSSSMTNIVDFAVDRLGTADGISSGLKVCEYVGKWIQYIPARSCVTDRASKFSDSFFKANTLVGTFGLIEQLRDCFRAYSLLADSSPINDDRNSAHSRVSKVARSTLSTINSATDVVNNLHDAGFVSLGKSASVSSGVFAATDIVCNFLTAKDEADDILLRNCELSNDATSDRRKDSLRLRNHVSKCKIVNSSICIIGSALALASLISGAFTVLPIIGLSLSTIWLSIKLYSQYRQSAVKIT